ncbi:MAG TPA: quinone-dependent dihydroorotate dehydrogenase, partial [Thermoanaerobaculia bacterium]
LVRLQGLPALLDLVASRCRVLDEKALWGLTFPNRLGIAAGFDKDALLPEALFALGFGFVEVGTVTLRPQAGNPRPRLFRYPEARALVNRMGFNNEGATAAAARLRRLVEHRGTAVKRGPLFVNIGKNRDVGAAEAAEAYASCYRVVAPWADGAIINVSSPNTPNLRDLQRPEHLAEILRRVREERERLSFAVPGEHPVLVKIAPDLTPAQLEEIAAVAAKHADGMVATNTTIDHSPLPVGTDEAGGLSGAPLFSPSTELLRRLRSLVGPSFPLVGVGGVMDASGARAKLEAGADLVQAYTGFIYGGPFFARDVVREMAR